MNKYTVVSYNKDNKRIDNTYQPNIPELVEFLEKLSTQTTTEISS